ncbi:hypothetical protein EKO27_g9907 [Xylaria grammica]|uniref:Uncharacterized protein n=1 Tax=Xylaria grammica TaxID=363999 RepID=A0A439CSW0_9PEZI|nr:hypothetical protein EKO27_g9907 [Xylaria grammica]
MEPDEEKSWLFEEFYPSERLEKSIRTIQRTFTFARIYVLILHAIIIALIVGIFITANSAKSCRGVAVAQSWSPVQEYIEYESQREYASEDTHSNFSGPPTAEQDEAWDELVKREKIHIEKYLYRR